MTKIKYEDDSGTHELDAPEGLNTNDDAAIQAALAPFVPWARGATLTRSVTGEDTVITLSKRAGPKG